MANCRTGLSVILTVDNACFLSSGGISEAGKRPEKRAKCGYTPIRIFKPPPEWRKRAFRLWIKNQTDTEKNWNFYVLHKRRG